MAVSAYMTLRGLFGVFRVGVLEQATLQLAGPQDLPSILSRVLGMDRAMLAWLVVAVVGGGFTVFALANREFRQFDYLLGAIVTGLVIVAGWYVTGRIGYLEEDPNTLEQAWVATNTGRMESLSFVAPQAFLLELLMLWSDKSRIVTFGIASALGVIAGSFAYAIVSKSFRLESFRDAPDMLRHIARRHPDGLRRRGRAGLHGGAGNHRLLDPRARFDGHLRGHRRGLGRDHEIRVLAHDARAMMRETEGLGPASV